jgi:hypothetical protein
MPTPLSQAYSKQKSPYRTSNFKVEITRTVGLWPRRVFVQWILRKPSTATGYTFNVYRSGGANGPWAQVATDLVDTYFFVDDTFNAPQDRSKPGLFSMRQTLYYKVTVNHATDAPSEVIRALEPGLDRRRAGIVRKLRRDAHVALKKGSGTQVAILKRRWWGEPCPECKTSTGQSTRSHCSTCHGTGIVEGYWDPVYGYATRSSAPVNNQTSSGGVTETHFLQVKMEYIPEVAPRDILVFLRDNKRYLIDRVVTTEIHTKTVHQELEVSELAHSAVEFNLTADNWHTPPWF